MNFINDLLPLKNKLYRTALRITLDTVEAEDIVQNTLVKIWTRRDSWQEIQSLEAYAITTARNMALDIVRQRQHQVVPLDSVADIPTTDTDPHEQLSQHERLQQIEQLMNTLPEKQRTCMQLRDIEGLPYKEIATILNISEEQVKISIFRARKALRTRLNNKS